jgi:hypothetical protein
MLTKYYNIKSREGGKMEEQMTAEKKERQLVEKFISFSAEVKRQSALLKEKEGELAQIEADLMELLDDQGKKSSARYEGVGHVTCVEPVPRASVVKGQEDILFAYLRKIGREDLIKTSVHAGSLSTLVKESLKQVAEGVSEAEIPPGITYYMDRRLAPYPIKK